MRSASMEWMARVAARNEIEMAKALGWARRPAPHENSGVRAVALSAGAGRAGYVGEGADVTKKGGGK